MTVEEDERLNRLKGEIMEVCVQTNCSTDQTLDALEFCLDFIRNELHTARFKVALN